MNHFHSRFLHAISTILLLTRIGPSSQVANDKYKITTTVKQGPTNKLLRDPRNNAHDYRLSTHSSRDFKKKVATVEELLQEDSIFWARQLLSMSSSHSYPCHDPKVEHHPEASSDLAITSKTSWPECIDIPLTCEECKAHIVDEKNPEIKIVDIIPYGWVVTADYRTDRVRIFCNETNVTTIPIIG
jgi:hypothetical protein